MTEPVEVRRLAPADLAAFQAGMPAWNATEYAKRIGFQERGLAVQLVAWAGEEPAGRAMVVFPGHPEWSPSAYREGCPEIRDLGVGPAWRRRGIATALVAAAERETRSAGFPRLGLGVGIDDDYAAARSLYERLGYVFAHAEGIIPAPESAHGLKAVIEEADAAREADEERVILVNLTGHGYFDMQAYDDYLNGRLPDFEFDPAAEDAALAELPDAPSLGG